MPRKVFVAGEILTAADVNTNLMDQAVMVFDDSAARGSAIPTPSEGMVTYLKDTNQVSAYNGAAFAPIGTILQVVSTSKTDTFTTSSNTFTGVTGLTASITPSSASSKVLIFAAVNAGNTNTSGSDTATIIRLSGGNSGTLVGDAASNRSRVAASVYSSSVYRNDVENVLKTIVYLDSPATTSSVTYGVEIATVPGSTGTVNRSGNDFDGAAYARSASTITVMEVAG